MNRTTLVTLLTFAALVLGLISGAAFVTAGPLTPPAGSVAPSYKTLGDVEPRTAISAANTPGNAQCVHRITQPGSYYLTGNIEAPSDMAAIEIAANDVTIDLAGFSVFRGPSGPSTRSLVRHASNFIRNTTLLNGTVRNSGLHGVELGSGAHIEKIRVEEPVQGGITVFGDSRIIDCSVFNPGAFGVTAQGNSLLERVIVNSSGAEGIVMMGEGRVTECMVYFPQGVGILAGNRTTVARCQVSNGASWGISAQLNTTQQTIRDNMLYQNALGNIRLYFRAVATGNHCSLSGAVPNIFAMESANRIEDNACSGGTDAVKVDPGASDNLVIRNSSVGATVGHGFVNIAAANNQIGPVLSAAGSITSSNPWANFSR